jgi:hypothetical protein
VTVGVPGATIGCTGRGNQGWPGRGASAARRTVMYLRENEPFGGGRMKKLVVLLGVAAAVIGVKKLLGGKEDASIPAYGPSDYTAQTQH